MKPRLAIRSAFCALLLFAITFALFAPSLDYGLVDLDDQDYISSNPLVMEGISLARLRSAFATFQYGVYSPLLWISYGLDATLFGASPANPWGFHFSNVLLHAFNSVLLFVLLFAFCKKPWRALFFAALWALHPLRVESVAWITERKDVLSGFFGLFCLGLYYQAKTRDPKTCTSILWTAASLLFFALGLLVKPALVPLPGALLLLDFWPLRRIDCSWPSIRRAAPRLVAEKIPFFLLAALASFSASAAHQAIHGLVDVPLSKRLMTLPVHYTLYLGKTVWPHNLSPLYPDVSPSLMQFGLASLLLVALTAWAWFSRNRQPERLVGWLFFLGFLLPAIGLVRFGAQSIADRFTYLPAIGLSIALLPIAPSRTTDWRAMRFTVAASLLSGLAVGTLRLLPAWSATSALIDHILRVQADNPFALTMRGLHAIHSAGDFELADAAFDRIIRSGSFNHGVITGKARCLAAREGPAAATAYLLAAPDDQNPYAKQIYAWDLARYALQSGEFDAALHQAERALELPSQDPTAPVYLHLLAMAAAYGKGDMPLALAHARQFPSYAGKTSLELTDLLPYYLHQWMKCHRDDAYAYFQRLIERYPERTDLLNNLAWGLATADWSPAPPAEVLALARKVNEAFPTPHAGALDTLAAAHANAGDFPAAVQSIQQALALLPSNGDGKFGLLRERLQSRLDLYRQRQPYREEAFSRWMAVQFGQGLPVTDKKAAP